MILRTAVSLLLLIAVGGAMIGCAARPEPAAEKWLAKDCAVGERGRLEQVLRTSGAPAERTLIEAFERGAPVAALDEVGTVAGTSYDEVLAALDAGRTYGLGASDVAAVRAISRVEHVRRARESFAHGYRSAALAGIAVIALPRGIALLTRVEADPRSPCRVSARVALQNFRASGTP